MIGLSYRASDFTPGQRFMTCIQGNYPFDHPDAYRTHHQPDLLLEVISNEGGQVTARDQHDELHTFSVSGNGPFVMGQNERGNRRLICWLGSIPAGTFDQLAPFADALLNSRSYFNRPLLLLVDQIDGENASARLIHPATLGPETDYTEEGESETPGTIHGNAFILNAPIGLSSSLSTSLDIGDLVVISRYKAGPSNSVPTIDEGTLAVIQSGFDPEAVGSWLCNPEIPHTHFRSNNPLNLGTWQDLSHQISRAIARTEPDEILVVAIEVHGPSGKQITHQSMGHTGIKLFEVDNINDDLWSSTLERGLWLGFDVTWYNAGDDGAEWEADWRPATLDDLKRFGYTQKSAAAEISAMIDEPVSPRRVKSLMEAAEAVASAEAAEKAARVAA